MTFALTSDLSDYLGTGFETAPQTLQAELALRIATSVVQSRTGQNFLAGSSTVTVGAPRGPWLSLPQRPVTAVAEVSINGTQVTDYTAVGSRLFRYQGWAVSYFAAPVVTVTYSHGGTVPDLVLGAVLAVAADIYENPTGLSSESIDDYTWRRSETSRGAEAAIALAEAVRAYRRRPLTIPTS